MIKPTDIIRKPLITEKASLVKENGWYVFSVLTSSNKNQIRDAVEKLFKVKVGKVRTLSIPGKKVKRFGRVVGKTSMKKKAYIKLKEGNIEFFEGV